MKNKKNIYISLNYHNLETLLQEVKKQNIPEDEYKNLYFQLDWSGCYYEGDYPEIELTGEIKKRKLIYQFDDSYSLSIGKKIQFFILGEFIGNKFIVFTDSNEEKWKDLIPKGFVCAGDSFEWKKDKTKAIDFLEKAGYTKFSENI